jgi:hypothetical protein
MRNLTVIFKSCLYSTSVENFPNFPEIWSDNKLKWLVTCFCIVVFRIEYGIVFGRIIDNYVTLFSAYNHLAK